LDFPAIDFHLLAKVLQAEKNTRFVSPGFFFQKGVLLPLLNFEPDFAKMLFSFWRPSQLITEVIHY
jgi:hypothetical protein